MFQAIRQNALAILYESPGATPSLVIPPVPVMIGGIRIAVVPWVRSISRIGAITTVTRILWAPWVGACGNGIAAVTDSVVGKSPIGTRRLGGPVVVATASTGEGRQQDCNSNI